MGNAPPAGPPSPMPVKLLTCSRHYSPWLPALLLLCVLSVVIVLCACSLQLHGCSVLRTAHSLL